MKFVRLRLKPVTLMLAVVMFLLSGPYQAALAAIVDTETALVYSHSETARNKVLDFLHREDVQATLISQGVDPDEAIARVNSLSNAEVNQVAEKLEYLPAGGNGLGTVLGIAVLVFLILLLTDILGVTDIFPFVKKSQE